MVMQNLQPGQDIPEKVDITGLTVDPEFTQLALVKILMGILLPQ